MSGQIFVDGQCFDTVSIGSSCQHTAQCLGGSMCTDFRCECPIGSRNIDGRCSKWTGKCEEGKVMVNGLCMELVMIGDQCLYSSQCLGNSNCVNGICQCPVGSTQNNGRCSSPECNENQTDTANVLTDKFCLMDFVQPEAKNAHHTKSVSSKCLWLVPLGARCKTSRQCMGFGICWSSRCRCRRGSNAVNGVCQRTTEYVWAPVSVAIRPLTTVPLVLEVHVAKLHVSAWVLEFVGLQGVGVEEDPMLSMVYVNELLRTIRRFTLRYQKADARHVGGAAVQVKAIE
ncbi:EB module [Dictyocaulus viviparus]|uniref:EB module n=1 Tax=Dictyocaulus viviparus TaxID=29172 RepID=A0A0D8Y922_DICVI|nr:EB module [Dictyocaulus viviparus]